MAIRTESLRCQNKQFDIKFSDVQLIRENSYFVLYINRQKINEYISWVYILNDDNFYIFDSNQSKWIAYKRIDGKLTEIYRSIYLILLYPKLIIEYYQSVLYVHSAGLDYDNNIKPRSLLFVGQDFKIQKGKLVVSNKDQMRVFRYNLKDDTHQTNIIQSSDSTIETKKNRICFDKIGSVEIYSKKKDVLLYNCNKFYKVFPTLYCLKNKDSNYTMYDIERGEEVFTGSALSYIEQFITLVNHNTDEIFVIDREKKTIRVYSWKKYQKGETKQFLLNYNFKKYGGE